MTGFDQEHKQELREKQFPLDLAEAFRMGRSSAEGSGTLRAERSLFLLPFRKIRFVNAPVLPSVLRRA